MRQFIKILAPARSRRRPTAWTIVRAVACVLLLIAVQGQEAKSQDEKRVLHPSDMKKPVSKPDTKPSANSQTIQANNPRVSTVIRASLEERRASLEKMIQSIKKNIENWEAKIAEYNALPESSDKRTKLQFAQRQLQFWKNRLAHTEASLADVNSRLAAMRPATPCDAPTDPCGLRGPAKIGNVKAMTPGVLESDTGFGKQNSAATTGSPSGGGAPAGGPPIGKILTTR